MNKEKIGHYIEYLSWDSDFFGMKVGRVQIADLIENNIPPSIFTAFLQQEFYKLVYLSSNYNDADCATYAKGISAKLVDSKVVWTKKVSSAPRPLGHPDIKSIKGENCSCELLHLAFQSGEYSRFKTDRNFESGAFERLYQTWIEKSLDGILADEVFAYTVDKKHVGLITVKKDKLDIEIGLLAVDVRHRQKEIGRNLMSMVELYCIEAGFNSIKVATQLQNETACEFYKRNKYSIKSIENIYHLWI